MMKKLAIAVVALLFLAPTLGLVTVGLVMNPAVIACLSSPGLTVGNVPDSLVVTTANGERFTLNKKQLTHAATIITVGSRIEGVTRDGVPRPDDLAFRTVALPAGETVTFERELTPPPSIPSYDMESLTVVCT